MKILNVEQRYTLENGEVINADNPAYLYEIVSDGTPGQRHGMVLNLITTDLAKKGLDLNNAKILDGYSLHNLSVSVFGPYLVNAMGEQIYTFRPNGYMVKLDPGTRASDETFAVKMPKDIYACISYEKNGPVRSIDYIAILRNGAIRFQIKYNAGSLRMDVLLHKEMPDDIKKHLLNKVEREANPNVTNNPAIGFKLLLDLLDEEETNGDKTNHSD